MVSGQPEEIGTVFLKGDRLLNPMNYEGRHGHGGSAGDPFRYPVAIQDVAVSGKYDQRTASCFQYLRDSFGHGVFPDTLGLVKIFKISKIPVAMLAENLFEKGTMLRESEINVSCNSITLLGGQCVETLSGDLSDNFPRSIYGEEASMSLPDDLDNWPVKAVGKSPITAPVDFFQELCLRYFPLEIAVDSFLLVSLEKFHGCIRRRIELHEGLQNLDLYQVVFGIGMDFTYEDEPVLCKKADELFK